MTKNSIKLDPTPKHSLSPWLYMQFMEPLGTTDGAVEAAWDHRNDKWFDCVIEKSKEIAPGLMRWGGILSAYYRWREAVGPRSQRVPMLNYLWGGIETNQIGTAEFLEFCEKIKADAFFCVNFLSEGKQCYAIGPHGEVRTAGPEEAAQWVDYCNNPFNKERISHGRVRPYNVKLWQLGNETSYKFLEDGFTVEETGIHTVAFAKAMRAVDPQLKFIGWGDSGWAPRLLEIAGEHIDYVAFHQGPVPEQKELLRDGEYTKDWDRSWALMMTAYKATEKKIQEMREQVAGSGKYLAMTEGHMGFKGHNRGNVQSTWMIGVAYARALNVHERNGDILKIATAADYCGTRWMNNALMINHPSKVAYLMPVAHVMSLYRRHSGESLVDATSTSGDLDITASITGNKAYIHVVNINKDKAVKAELSVAGKTIKSGKVFQLKAEPSFEIMITTRDDLKVEELDMQKADSWTFPSGSVSAVELELE